jgi:hypothetical protein
MVSIETTIQPTTAEGKTTGGSSSELRQPVTIPPSNNPYARLGPEKYFKCNQSGHWSNQCPKRQMVNFIEAKDAEDVEDDEIGDDIPGYEATDANADDGVLLSRSLVIRQVLLTQSLEDQSQRHNIFHTHCTVNQRVCDVIINRGSGENIVSKVMVAKLGLKIERHPAPYKIGRIKRGTETSYRKMSFHIFHR